MATRSEYDIIRNEIESRRFKPIYLFMGEEGYFIDELSNLLVNTVLTEEEKDFNMLTFYGVDSDVNEIIAASRRYPMMAEHQLILVKEAQNLADFDMLGLYAKNPMMSTILVINYKHGSVDKRKGIVKKINKIGVLFESKKLYDNQIPGFITAYLKQKEIAIDPKSAQMLNDFVGNDVSKLIPELEKLETSLPQPPATRRITTEMIEKNVGISRDYNNFELLKAVASRNITAVNRIIIHFAKNQKENPIMVTVAVLFNYFSNLLECYWLPRKDERSVMAALQLRSSFFARDYMEGIKNYNATKVMDIISELRCIDARSKGVDNVSVSPGDLLKELLHKIIY